MLFHKSVFRYRWSLGKGHTVMKCRVCIVYTAWSESAKARLESTIYYYAYDNQEKTSIR